VLAEVCLKRLNNPTVDDIFPGYNGHAAWVFETTRLKT